MSGHGGKRHHHVAPLLTYEQVRRARLLRSARVPYKIISRKLGVSRDILSEAVNGRRAYAGFAIDLGSQNPKSKT